MVIVTRPPWKVKEAFAMAEKSRYWAAVCYPENMIPDWQNKIDDLIEFPFAYCVHDLDHDQKSEHRKDHVHIMVAWSNTTTKKAAMELMNRLSAPGRSCCPVIQSVHNVRRSYDYLIHDTDKCREDGKYQYPKEARIEGNNFDIGAFEQISAEEKGEAAKEICKFCIDRGIENLSDVFTIVTESEDFSDVRYWEAFKLYNAMIERICKGVYLKRHPAEKKK